LIGLPSKFHIPAWQLIATFLLALALHFSRCFSERCKKPVADSAPAGSMGQRRTPRITGKRVADFAFGHSK
jgi:hypothetical protein